MRVVSLLPSATELLCAAGGEDLLVGRSHECDWPPSVRDRPVLTAARTSDGSGAAIDRAVRDALAKGESLYTLDVERLRALRPDVILTQDLCEVCSIDLHAVRRAAADLPGDPRVVSLNPTTLEDVLDDLLRVGEAVGRERAAREAVVRLREAYWTTRDFVNPYLEGPEVLFLEWMDPPFVGGHWTPGLIRDAGGRHSLNEVGAKSRPVDPEAIVEARPERAIVCPCGWTLADIERRRGELEDRSWWRSLPAVHEGRVAWVDGNALFNRPGPRLVDAYRWLVGWIHDRPELVPEGVGELVTA